LLFISLGVGHCRLNIKEKLTFNSASLRPIEQQVEEIYTSDMVTLVNQDMIEHSCNSMLNFVKVADW